MPHPDNKKKGGGIVRFSLEASENDPRELSPILLPAAAPGGVNHRRKVKESLFTR